LTQPHDFFADPEVGARYGRLEDIFRAHDTLATLINRILDEEGARMTVRDGREHLLSTFVSACLGRGMRDCEATSRLCLLGFGEQAMIVLRSTVNLLVNLNYILTDADPMDRLDEFLAFSHEQFVKFMLGGYGQKVDWEPDWTSEERARKVKAWKATGIGGRAKRLAKHHYEIGYRFYSSAEHADVLALLDRIDWDGEDGPRVSCGSSDQKIDVTLYHSFMVMAELLDLVCRYFNIKRPDVFNEIRRVSADVAASREKRK
jgi:hypothetical protein